MRIELKIGVLTALSVLFFYAGYANAEDIGAVAAKLTGTFENIAKLVTGMAYVVGMGFGVSAMLKFKAHKDNPQGTPLGTPMMLLFVAAGLLFLPSLFTSAGKSLFESPQETGIKGVTSFSNSK
ncbi:MAG: type IV secretion protein IcmD [Gammaproteobacteria bacterium]